MRLTLQIKLLLIVILGVFVPMELCVIYVLHKNREEVRDVFLRQGRVMFNQVLITRRWLSQQGGVYVHKSPFVKSSPFIDNADTSTLQGDPITLRTPDMVTREISQLSGQEHSSHFRIVSLDPVNPANLPSDPWETRALRSFAAGAKEAWIMSGEGGAARFRYMAPLFTEASCLSCHQESGHRAGDVRGAISLDFPVGDEVIQAEHDRLDLGLLATGLGLSAILLLWLAARRIILGPLATITTAVEGMGRGDYSRPLVPRSRDQLGDLARTVSEMRDTIRDYSQNLERQVAARTSELLEINQTLEAKVSKQTEALLEQEKLAALGEVSAGLAHEIRNPLSAILSGISLLESGKRTEAERLHIIKLIRREAGRLNTSLTDFLLFARPQQPTMVRIDLNGIIREIVRLIEEDPDIKGEIDLRLELAELPPIWFDDDQLRQMVWNIVLNALQSMDHRGLLTIRTGRDGDNAWRLEVSDTGPGIPEEIRDRVYDPFFSTKRDGTGLGLSIVRRIVAAHHGNISFECPAAKGCVFVITAPISVPEKEQEA